MTSRGCGWLSGAGGGFGGWFDDGFGFELRQQGLRGLLHLPDLDGFFTEIGVGLLALQYRQGAFGAPLGVGIAAAVEIGLRQRIGLVRLFR